MGVKVFVLVLKTHFIIACMCEEILYRQTGQSGAVNSTGRPHESNKYFINSEREEISFSESVLCYFMIGSVLMTRVTSPWLV